MYVNDPPPRTPMSVVLSVKDSGAVQQKAEDVGIKATWDSGKHMSVLSLEKFFGGHSVIETGYVTETAPYEVWVKEMAGMLVTLAKRMREMQVQVTPDIAALLNVVGVTGLHAIYSPSHDCWQILDRDEDLIRTVPTDGDYETWRETITKIADHTAKSYPSAPIEYRDALLDAQQGPSGVIPVPMVPAPAPLPEIPQDPPSGAPSAAQPPDPDLGVPEASAASEEILDFENPPPPPPMPAGTVMAIEKFDPDAPPPASVDAVISKTLTLKGKKK